MPSTYSITRYSSGGSRVAGPVIDDLDHTIAVRPVELGRDLHLLHEPLDVDRVLPALRMEHLDRDLAPEHPQVVRQIHRGERPGADLPDQRVPPLERAPGEVVLAREFEDLRRPGPLPGRHRPERRQRETTRDRVAAPSVRVILEGRRQARVRSRSVHASPNLNAAEPRPKVTSDCLTDCPVTAQNVDLAPPRIPVLIAIVRTPVRAMFRALLSPVGNCVGPRVGIADINPFASTTIAACRWFPPSHPSPSSTTPSPHSPSTSVDSLDISPVNSTVARRQATTCSDAKLRKI
jgi:hypothetical protein